MKRIIPFVSILLVCISLISPILTHADDVTIGDNDVEIVSDDNLTLGKKLSILEALGDLIADGVSSFTISNATSTDDYVDYLLFFLAWYIIFLSFLSLSLVTVHVFIM